MRIYFGIPESKEYLQKLENRAFLEIALLSGNFQEFLVTTPAIALYLPFPLLERWNVIPKAHVSQVLHVPEGLREKFKGTSFILTGPALEDDDPKTSEYEAELLFDCLIKGMKEKNIGSLAVWGGFFAKRLDYKLCIEKLQLSIAKNRTQDGDSTVIVIENNRRKYDRRGTPVQKSKRSREGELTLTTFAKIEQSYILKTQFNKPSGQKFQNTLKEASKKNYEYKAISSKSGNPSKKPK